MKKIFLTIPEPCQENWDQMTPCEKGRFCNSCRKTVFDFMDMQDHQLANFFKAAPTDLCGHLNKEQLERFITIPKKKIPIIRYFFQLTLPAFLISIKSYSQKTLNVHTQAVKKNSLTTDQKPLKTILISQIEGTIKDTSGLPVAFATISLKESYHTTISDEEGHFKLSVNEPRSTLIISAIGYEQKEVELKNKEFVEITMIVKSSVMQPVVISSDNYITGRLGGLMAITVIEKPWIQKVADTIFSCFTIYPNPVQKNGSFKMKIKEPGQYQFLIVDSKGSAIKRTELLVNNKNEITSEQSINRSAGIYFVYIVNSKTGKSYSKKLIVQ
jgi:hypothetical protein